MGGKKEKVHLSTYDTHVIQLGNTNNKMATPAPVQLQLPLTGKWSSFPVYLSMAAAQTDWVLSVLWFFEQCTTRTQ